MDFIRKDEGSERQNQRDQAPKGFEINEEVERAGSITRQ